MCIHESIFVQIVSNNLHFGVSPLHPGAFLLHFGAFLLHLGAFLLHSGAFPFRTPVPHHSFIFRTSVSYFFHPSLAPGGKVAGNAGDVIVSEEHCILLDRVQAGC